MKPLLYSGLDFIRQRSGKKGQGIDLRRALAQHLADSALAAVLTVDIGFEPLLISAELALQGSGVQVLHPALGLIDLRALPGGAGQGGRIQRHGLLQIPAVAVNKVQRSSLTCSLIDSMKSPCLLRQMAF